MAQTIEVRELLKRENDKGRFRLVYIHDEQLPRVAGLYVDIAYNDGTGYGEYVASYREGAHKVFDAYGQYPEYAQ